MTMSTRPASITDVARLANVSVPTVSRVLTGAAKVSPDKVARIEAAIAELDFRPSAVARALVTGSSNILVVLTSNTTRYGYAATIEGIESAARSAGMSMMIAVVQSGHDDHVNAAVSLALTQPMAGIVVLKFDPIGVAVLDRIPAGIPVAVAAGAQERGRPQAVIDEFHGGEEATQYLLSLGHRTVHHVSIPPSRVEEDSRTLGWRHALVQAGISPPDVVRATWDPQSGVRIGQELAQDREVTAVLCGNDEIAMGFISGARASGREVPRDISVIGFDNHPLSAVWAPALTTVAQDFVALGRSTFGLLADSIAGVTSATETIEKTQLIVRASTAHV